MGNKKESNKNGDLRASKKMQNGNTASEKNGNVINDPMAVTWSEKYKDEIEYYWDKLPNFLKGTIATLAIFIMGISINGKFKILSVTKR